MEPAVPEYFVNERGHRVLTIVFHGNAADLFSPHEVWGPFSGLKRLLGQQKASFGDIVFDDAYKVGSHIHVYEAHIGSHLGRSANLRAARLWGRRVMDIGFDSIIASMAGLYGYNYLNQE